MAQEIQREQEFDLRHYFHILSSRKWIVIGFTTALTAIVAVGTALQPKVYEAKATVLAGRESPRLLNFDPLPQERFRERDYLKTQAAILTSRSFLQGAVKRLMKEGFYGNVPPGAVEGRSEVLARELQYRTRVQTADDSMAISITVEGGVPERVARTATAIAEEFVSSSLSEKQTMAGEVVSWLDSRLAEQRVKLQQAEGALQAFKDKEHIVASDDADPFSTVSLSRLNDEFMTTQFQRIEREARLATLKKKSGGPRSAPTAGGPATQSLDVEVQKRVRDRLEQEYVDAQLELKNLSQRYGPEHPDIITLKGRVAKIRFELENLMGPEPEVRIVAAPVPETRIEDLQAEYNALLSRERSLAQALGAQKAQARNLSRTAVRYSILKQEVDQNRVVYNDLMDKRNGASLSGQIRNPAVRVLDKAVIPESPVEPQPIRNLLVAVFLGLVLGVGLVVLRENLDRRVRNPADAARFVGLPLLAVVPGIGVAKGAGHEEGKSQLVTIQQPRSHVAECYRNLRTSILFSSSGRPVPKTIVVTSAVAGEGKSTTAANLAVVMAQSGRKVLLIDADLRRPALHRYFVRQGGRGLIRLLKENCRPEEAIQASGIEGLDVLLCHGLPSNPSELLGSERMQSLVDQLKGKFDFVIIDSPVVISVADALILAARAEATLMVHRPGATDRDMVRHAREKLVDVGANVLGLVMNQVDLKAGRYDYPEYLYYGYGTGEDDKVRKGKKKP